MEIFSGAALIDDQPPGCVNAWDGRLLLVHIANHGGEEIPPQLFSKVGRMNVRKCEGFRMPAGHVHGTFSRLRRPASENLQRTKPREIDPRPSRELPAYGDLMKAEVCAVAAQRAERRGVSVGIRCGVARQRCRRIAI